MKKFSKGLLLVLASILATACSDADTKAPQIITESDQLYSIFDTVEVTFNENLKDFNNKNFESSPKLTYSALSANKYGFYADSTWMRSFSAMHIDSTYEITFKNVSDDDGNQSGELKFVFRTMNFLDSDFQDDGEGGFLDNNTLSNADLLMDSVKFFQGSPAKEGMSISAGLSDRANSSMFDDHVDVFRVLVRKGDSLDIKLSGFSVDLDLEFKGPINISESATTDISLENIRLSENLGLKTEELHFKVDANTHSAGTVVMSDYLDYWISVYYKDLPGRSDPSQTPYVLYVKKIPGN